VSCWSYRELLADEALTPYGQLRPQMDRHGDGLVELVQLAGGAGGEARYSWRARVVRVPCGKCPGCWIDWSREWAVRLLCEVSAGHRGYPEHRECDTWFVTLTFDDAHVPRMSVGGVEGRKTLDVEVFAAFEKRLREWLRWWYPESRYRRLANGEYGSLRLRPHHHAVFVDVPLEDARVSTRHDRGKFPLFESPSLTRLWGMGDVILGKVTRASAAYVVAYMAKSARWPYGVVEPFRVMSTGSGRAAAGGSLGGLGSAYFDKHWSEVYAPSAGEYRGMICTGEPGDVKWLPAPRYFNRRLREAHFDEWVDFEHARLAKAAELREAMTVNNRQARVIKLWESVTKKTRDGLFPGASGPVLPVTYGDGRVERVEVVQRFDDYAVMGAYGPERGFRLSDYLDEIGRVAAAEAREVPVFAGMDSVVLDSEGNPARFDFLEGEVRRRSRGLVGQVFGLNDLVLPGVGAGGAGGAVPLLPGGLERHAGFAEVAR